MRRARVSSELIAFPPDYTPPRWVRAFNQIASAIPPLRDFCFRLLSPGRVRTFIVGHYFHQIVEWMSEADYPTLMRQVAPDAVVEIFELGTYSGRAGWEQGLREWFDSFAAFRLESRECFCFPGSSVLIAGRMTGTGAGSGISVDRELSFMVEVKRGMAANGRLFGSKAEGLAALGREE